MEMDLVIRLPSWKIGVECDLEADNLDAERIGKILGVVDELIILVPKEKLESKTKQLASDKVRVESYAKWILSEAELAKLRKEQQ